MSETPLTTGGEMMTIDAKELTRLQSLDEVSTRVIAQQRKVLELKADWKRKADASLAAKKQFDEQDAVLLEMITELSDPQQRLPFRLDAEAAGNGQPPPAPEPITDGWEMVPVSALGLPKGLTGKLEEAGCKRIGELEARRRDKGRALDIDGIGEKLAGKVNDTLDDWLRQNRDKAVFDSAAAAAPSPPVQDAKCFKLLVDIADPGGGKLATKGTILPLGERLDGGKLFLTTSPDDGFSVEEKECVGVNAVERATRVEITNPVPGSDNETDGLNPGAQVDVVSYHGENPVVKCKSEREVLITPAEFKPLKTQWVEVTA